MDDERRNPYLILGLDYGASKDDARRAAARVLRKVKTTPEARYATEDVTWALHEVEHVNDDPEAGVTIFRIPANPSLFESAVTEGLFSPTARPEPRSSPGSSEEDLRRLTAVAIREVASLLLAEYASVIDTRPSYDSREMA